MKYHRVISTAVLFMLLATTLPAFAQKGDEEKGGGGQKAQPAQHEQQPQRAQPAQHQAQPQRAEKAQPPQRAEKAQPQQREQKAQPQRAQQVPRQAQPQRAEKAQPQRAQAQQPAKQRTQTVASNRGGGGGGGNYGRISNANYSAHFGQGHSFHMGHPQMRGGYNRFQYGGYWFGYNEGWPVGWDYNDDCYVEYIDGYYYMFDVRHPGFRLTLNIF
jgi:hypothetical protein